MGQDAMRVKFETLRSLAFGSIPAAFNSTTIGSALAHPVRALCFTNTTDADVEISDDGSNAKLIIPAASFKLYDFASNRTAQANFLAVPVGTLYYPKYVTMPGKGAIYLEVVYAG